MKVVAISDTHEHHSEVEIPECDLLLHAGDITTDFRQTGKLTATADFLKWFSKQPAKHKIFIAGNHDIGFCEPSLVKEFKALIPKDVIYLCHEEVTIEGLKIFGTPWQPYFYGYAFNADKFDDEKELKERFASIPDDTDILLTHCPPYGILDNVSPYSEIGNHAGSSSLMDRVNQLNLTLHVFGHIHVDYGIFLQDSCQFINAALVNGNYNVCNDPVVLTI